MKIFVLVAVVVAELVVIAFLAAKALSATTPPGVPAFWERVAICETGGLWDWGAYAGTSRQRRGEGRVYEGGVGFYWQTWIAWSRELGIYRRYPHAYLAPPKVQAFVAAYGLKVHNGYWGCLH